jgi:carbamoyl-phosphate synthase small subunit
MDGMRLKDKMAFSGQDHPESSPGPHDSRYLFTEFARLALEYKNSKKLAYA